MSDTDADPRLFRFAIRCRYCNLSFHTTHSAKEHFVYACPRRALPKIRWGCCGTSFRNWGRCASHLNVCSAHLRGPTDTVTVSTTSSSEAESVSHEPSSRAHTVTQPVQVKSETMAATSFQVTADIHPSSTPPAPAASASVSQLSFSASDVSLTVRGLDLSTDNPILQQVATAPASGAGTGEDLTITSVLPPPTPTSTNLQTGVAPHESADLWRQRFYTLANHVLFWVKEISESQDIAIQPPTDNQLAHRLQMPSTTLEIKN